MPSPPHLQDFDLQTHLTDQHQHLLLKDEAFHLQRAKKNWATLGDRNTSFFHLSIIKRNRKNRISYLQNTDGSHATTPEQLAHTLQTYFQNIFSFDPNRQHSNDIDSFNDSPFADQGNTRDGTTDFTNSVPQIEELRAIIKNMRSNASPGPDGLNAAFYKSTWP